MCIIYCMAFCNYKIGLENCVLCCTSVTIYYTSMLILLQVYTMYKLFI